MNPNATAKRKQFVIYGIIAGVALLIMLVVPTLFKKKPEQVDVPKIQLLEPQKAEEESFKAVYGTELTDLKQKNEELKKELEAMKSQLEEERKRNFNTPLPPPPPPSSGLVTEYENSSGSREIQQKPQMEQLSDLIALNERQTTDITVKDESNKEDKKEEPRVKIPSGSIVKAVLLSGMDAPTGGNARSQPHPVLFRVMDLAVLPNFFKEDIKDCFVIGSGYGDLSSERAYIRLETLSCVARDKTIIEMPVKGYVTGEDGKIGLQGRVVTKQGQLLARTLIAGFLQGVAEAYKQANTVVSVSPNGQVSTIPPDKAMETGLYGGASSAAQKLADFYMKLVNEMYPVIEINAGRNVDLIFLSSQDNAGGNKS